MQRFATPDALMTWASAHRAAGRTVGLVPTMGFLHAGHVSLMEALRPQCDVLVTSIFVNPLQFGAGEDLDRYPRDPEGDLAKCEAAGCDAVFSPTTMFPPDFSTRVAVDGPTQGLCGASRPTHFEGVTTVVARLFGVSRCSIAAFGEKDFQQLAVIRRMVRDLAMPVTIVPGPIVRDRDGLALSSRNKYLSVDERACALSLHRALLGMANAWIAGETSASALTAMGREAVVSDRLDYLELVDAETLQPVRTVSRPARALVAAYFGGTRLIDNVHVGPSWT